MAKINVTKDNTNAEIYALGIVKKSENKKIFLCRKKKEF
jgi:hypothetical protein